MCVQYWPAGKNREEVYSGIGVTVENEEQLANFMIRTIRMRKVSVVWIEKYSVSNLLPFVEWGGKKSDTIPLYGMAVPFQSIFQCLARVSSPCS